MKRFLEIGHKFQLRNVFSNVSRRKFSSTNTLENKQNICVVGAGAAGFYVAQYLLKRLPNSHIDIVEKLPVPFGLVRFGVAPDHPEVKNVINTFTKTAENERLRFLGNLSLGTDFSLSELKQSYHAVILAYGAEKDRKLNILNENDSNVLSARDFVAWYNGLPGAENLKPNLSVNNVAIIGQGNVAIDVSRILLSPLSELRKTDITQYALDALSESKVNHVYLVGRRGPLQAAFTIKELREMTKLTDVSINWRSEDFMGIKDELDNLPRPRRRLVDLMLTSMSGETTNKKRQFLPIFYRAPTLIESNNNLQLTVNRMVGNNAVATEETELLKSDLVLRSIGYKAITLDNDIHFDEANGRVFNHGGRVLKKQPKDSDISIDNIEDTYETGVYVAGWLATGPTGVIVTTMNNSFAVAQNICDDFDKGLINTSVKKSTLDYKLKNKDIVTWKGWQTIDKAEVEAGKLTGKPREKIVNVSKMLNIAL